MPRLPTFFCDTFEVPLPLEHRFPASKYRELRLRVAAELGNRVDLREGPAATDAQLLRVHTPEYLAKLTDGRLTQLEQRRIGFPWSAEMVERSRRSTGATIAAAHSAWQTGIGLHLSGGTHHAFADHGQGFCVFNDVVVALRELQQHYAARQITVIDLDVHQGNGTAHLLANDCSVFTCSFHGQRNFPFRKCNGDLDLPLADGTTDDEYLQLLHEVLTDRVPLAASDMVFYIAGADPFQGDKYGRLALSKAGLEARDRLVMQACRNLAVPLTVVMGGGYAPAIQDIVDIHFGTVAMAAELFA